MIRLRLPVEAHHFGVDPMGELYEMLGYEVTTGPDGTTSVEVPSSLDLRATPQILMNFDGRCCPLPLTAEPV